MNIERLNDIRRGSRKIHVFEGHRHVVRGKVWISTKQSPAAGAQRMRLPRGAPVRADIAVRTAPSVGGAAVDVIYQRMTSDPGSGPKLVILVDSVRVLDTRDTATIEHPGLRDVVERAWRLLLAIELDRQQRDAATAQQRRDDALSSL